MMYGAIVATEPVTDFNRYDHEEGKVYLHNMRMDLRP